MNAIARLNTVDDLLAEYLEKDAGIPAAIEAFDEAKKTVEMAGAVMGTYVGPLITGTGAYVHENQMRRQLLQSAWKAVYNRLPIDRIASANDKRRLEQMLAAPPPFTIPNIKEQFGHYFENPRRHILRGLAETFCALDPAYKSHTKVKIGVKGLPKRVIVSNVGGWFGSYGRDRLRDILNALAAYQGKPLVEYHELEALLKDGDALKVDREIPDPRQSEYDRTKEGEKTIKLVGRDIWLKRYSNGNGHLYFGPEALRDINRGLAEFYGDVLPDVDPDAPEKAPSTGVAKDLQFYWTPRPVIDAAMEFASVWNLPEWRYNPPDPLRVLEPSCGDGCILDELRRRGHETLGIEYHAGRAAQAKAKGHSVVTTNFLECPPRAEFDRVVMNPPFYGRHYVKHVRHALKFLKPGGTLVAILPATAHYDHKELEGDWRDLPIASFAEAGTNVPTGLLRIRSAT